MEVSSMEVCVKTYGLGTVDSVMDARVLSMDGNEIMLRSVWQSRAWAVVSVVVPPHSFLLEHS